jgi:hypothetical protein
MVSEIRVYIEGGGDSRTTKDELRKGYHQFMASLYAIARPKRIRFHIVMCGGRDSAYSDFMAAIAAHPNAFNILLVDAEAPVTGTPWAHLNGRDGWPIPGATDDHCHLMVEMLESWLIADVNTLATYYGQGFHWNSIPKNQNVEAIPKAAINTALVNSTRHTQKGEYKKIRDASRLLAVIDAAVVRGKAAHCDRLFTLLAGKMA